MSRPIIAATNLGKQYQLGPSSRLTFRESISDGIKAPLRWLRGQKRPQAEPFWALRDVNFEVQAGEAVGIIGRNGAGKSTLLKILSRITAPSTGEARLRGKVASLLEVGTGFHSELSGRENIFLNGAIMGMTRVEVRARFDEIVAFAEVEEFLDTPVKRYSSGMYVRLAFAVAAHLQPDILIVDEVLAVGDASFQKKCLGKMQTVASGGRTVLFVSHNMPAVARLCSRALLLQKGTITAEGAVATVIGNYLAGAAGESPTDVEFGDHGPASEDVRLLAARVRSQGMEDAIVDIRAPVMVEIEYQVLREHYPLHPNFLLFNEEQVCVFGANDSSDPSSRAARAPGRYRAVAQVPGNLLAEGQYSLDIAVSTLDPVIAHVWERGLLSFSVRDPGQGDSARGTYGGNFPGVVRPKLEWSVEALDAPALRKKGLA